MKTLFKTLLFISFLVDFNLANGVGVVDAANQKYLRLVSTYINVEVENQIGLIKSTQHFRNEFDNAVNFKYAFPLPEGASALSLRWFINGEWNEASISSQEQDTTLPGGGEPHPSLKEYLGEVPLYFGIQDTLNSDSTIIIELTYVQFLKYSFGNVNFSYPNDYTLIQTSPLSVQDFSFTLNSSRTIDDIELLSHSPTQLINNGNHGFIEALIQEQQANIDFKVLYTLSLNELGLFSFSTNQPDSLLPDTLDNGYFVFVAEPDPSQNTDVIDKVFTLILDRSGSMYGDKIEQAKNAASFIVQNLNEGDKFNIVDFSSEVSSFRQEHVEFNPTTMSQALNYISSIQAGDLTNISGAFDTAVPQFSVANDSTANIIIFLTDGLPTIGITESEALVDHINQLIKSTEKNILVFSFGIGLDVDQQLLSLISNDNSGFATFLLNSELEEKITNFYLQIRNPVLLNTSLMFSPDILSEIYPDPLPNLYKGQQMIVSGRYSGAGTVDVTLSGEAFGQPVSYNYQMQLSDSEITNYSFLPKVWAKQKIEHLLVLYYLSSPIEAEAIKQQIIDISIAYGVISPFTSFSDPGTQVIEDKNTSTPLYPEEYKLLGNYPNPFNPSTTISFFVAKALNDLVIVRIYNTIGELIANLYIYVSSPGIYEVTWDGRISAGLEAPSGIYVYVVDFGDRILANKMVLSR